MIGWRELRAHLLRGDRISFPKLFGKIADALKTAGIADFAEGEFCSGQKVCGFLNAELGHELHRGLVQNRPEAPKALPSAHLAGIGNLVNGDFLLVVFANEINHTLDPSELSDVDGLVKHLVLVLLQPREKRVPNLTDQLHGA